MTFRQGRHTICTRAPVKRLALLPSGTGPQLENLETVGCIVKYGVLLRRGFFFSLSCPFCHWSFRGLPSRLPWPFCYPPPRPLTSSLPPSPQDLTRFPPPPGSAPKRELPPGRDLLREIGCGPCSDGAVCSESVRTCFRYSRLT